MDPSSVTIFETTRYILNTITIKTANMAKTIVSLTKRVYARVLSYFLELDISNYIHKKTVLVKVDFKRF
jgi:hypothetical protein